MGNHLIDVTLLDTDSVQLCLVEEGKVIFCIEPIRTELEDAGIFCSVMPGL
jgi:hypothetical protein